MLPIAAEKSAHALDVIHELGGDDQPRRTIPEDVAVALDCAARTAGDRLRRAEVSLLDAAVGGPGQSRYPAQTPSADLPV